MKKHDLSASTEILTTRGWLSAQPEAFQATILSRIRLKKYAEGETVFELGDPGGGIVGIVNGGASVSIAPNATGPHLSHIARPGWWFGEGPFLIGGPRRTSLCALTDCTLANLSLPAMNQIAATDPENIRRFSQIAMFNMDLTLQAISDLLLPEAERRLAAVLWRIVDGQSDYTLPVTQQQLGRLANTSRKKTMAAIRYLTENGALRQRYGALEVNDAQLLRDIADADDA